MLTAQELLDLRADVEADLAEGAGGMCEITGAVDGSVQTWPGATASVVCSITNPTTGGGEIMYSGDEPSVTIHVPIGTQVKTGDRVVNGNTTYKVVDIDAAQSTDLLLRLTAVEVRTPGGSS